MKNTIFLFGLIAFYLTGNSQEIGSFTDSRDSKVYKTVTINGQTWMAENLAFKSKGDCWAYDNNEKNVATYGYLYSWKTAKEGCPKGWHLPSDIEWYTLTDYLGGESSGGKLKEIGLTHWKNTNEGATNETGFTALPGGYRFPTTKSFVSLGYFGYWWTSTERKNGFYAYKNMNGKSVEVKDEINKKTLGISVRCLKD